MNYYLTVLKNYATFNGLPSYGFSSGYLAHNRTENQSILTLIANSGQKRLLFTDNAQLMIDQRTTV